MRIFVVVCHLFIDYFVILRISDETSQKFEKQSVLPKSYNWGKITRFA